MSSATGVNDLGNTHSWRCQCGRTVSLGATCECNVMLADQRIAVALERIASVLTTLRDALVGDGRHRQEPAPPGPFSHDHGGVLSGS